MERWNPWETHECESKQIYRRNEAVQFKESDWFKQFSTVHILSPKYFYPINEVYLHISTIYFLSARNPDGLLQLIIVY